MNDPNNNYNLNVASHKHIYITKIQILLSNFSRTHLPLASV